MRPYDEVHLWASFVLREESWMRDVLIIDGQNLFIRSYCAYPQMTSDGEQAGGIVGFMKSMAVICRQYAPSKVYVVWEGGGSSRRRKLFPDYKAHRRPEKLNRFYEDDIPDTDDNKTRQIVSLIRLLRHAPVCQVYVSDCEGDDVVSYMCKVPLRGTEKLIVSSDKDMLQLLDEKTRVYSPHRKKVLEARDVFEEYRISSGNFAIAKCLCGDPTDNVPGVKGLGFKTVSKRFPILSGDPVILQDVIDYASSHVDESIAYRRVVDSVDDIRRNWQLVHLDGSMLSYDQQRRVDHVMQTCTPRSDRVGLIRGLIDLKIPDFDVPGFFYDMSCVEQGGEETRDDE